MAKKLYYKIGEACKMLGIEAYVLRYWETEFPFLNPTKSRSGQRVYGEDELGLIRRIKELLYEEGYTIAGAKRKLEAEIESGVLGAQAGGEPKPETVKTVARKRRDAPDATPPDATPPDATAATSVVPAAVVDDANGAETPAESGAQSLAVALDDPPAVLDSAGAEEIQRLRSGIELALQHARDVLRLLDASA